MTQALSGGSPTEPSNVCLLCGTSSWSLDAGHGFAIERRAAVRSPFATPSLR